MDKKTEIELTQYSAEELILFAGVSYNTITNAIDNGEVEMIEGDQTKRKDFNY
ncbi:MAG TPA: hypothetical protein VJ824_17985 [Bacillota bacterium]|nr:hypothetical protein [Bacillota bacterium]